MRNRILTAVLSTGLLFGTMQQPVSAATYHHHYQTQHQYVKHKRHMKTLKRVGIGAAGGAGIGALVGGGTGAAVGALVGGGGGALYDRHKKHHGHY
jgi:outer membrane lipoprotein SlyB